LPSVSDVFALVISAAVLFEFAYGIAEFLGGAP